jgi:hypothetical protein
MKVTIDTKEDSHDDIKKILHILTNILENKNEIPAPVEDTTSMMSMFSAPVQEISPKVAGEPQPVEQKETPPDFSSFINLSKRDEEPKDETRIQYF